MLVFIIAAKRRIYRVIRERRELQMEVTAHLAGMRREKKVCWVHLRDTFEYCDCNRRHFPEATEEGDSGLFCQGMERFTELKFKGFCNL